MGITDMSTMQKTMHVLTEAGVRPDVITAFIATWAICFATRGINTKEEFNQEFDKLSCGDICFSTYLGNDLATHMKLNFFNYIEYLFDYGMADSFNIDKPDINSYIQINT